MKQLAAQLSIATFTTLSTFTFATGAEAADLALRGDLLEVFSSYVREERMAFNELDLPELDASNLYWNGTVDDVEVFFVNEGAAYKNQLLFTANDGPMEIIFNNISSRQSILKESSGVLSLGEGRALSGFSGPTQLSFFLKANGFNGGKNIYGSKEFMNSTVDGKTVNPDGLSHLIAYNYFDEVDQESYTIIGFEDLYGPLKKGGSDRDFNDVVFAVRGLVEGKPEEKDIPEPSALLGLIGLAAMGRCLRRMS
ncbi:MAG: DUF4114 domain-containing protein [Phormidesmis sp.]